MNIKTLLFTILILFSITLKTQNMQQETKKYSVVIQLSSSDTLAYKAVINNIHNILKAFDKIDIALVAHGDGIGFLLKTSVVKNDIALLHQKGVVFIACQNTLTKKKLDKDSLLTFSTIVPSGIAHIIHRQTEGWSYIKAGF